MKIVTVVQARSNSSRLPKKVLLPVCGQYLLVHMINRIKRAKLAGWVVVATTTDPDDDKIEKICDQNDILCFRGNPVDLLDRHYQAGLLYQADVVVKIPSDCPLIDPMIIDRVIGFYLDSNLKYDFVSNLHPATYPDGNDVEVFSFQALKTAWQEARQGFEREHTTPFIWEHPDKFRIGNVSWETGLDYSSTHRWTIDYVEDYDFICKVYNVLFPVKPAFDLNDILNLLNERPDIANTNRQYAGMYWYLNHLNELKTIDEYKNKLVNNEIRNNSN